MERVGLEWWGWVVHGREENQLHHTFQKENAKEEGSVPELDVAMQCRRSRMQIVDPIQSLFNKWWMCTTLAEKQCTTSPWTSAWSSCPNVLTNCRGRHRRLLGLYSSAPKRPTSGLQRGPLRRSMALWPLRLVPRMAELPSCWQSARHVL